MDHKKDAAQHWWRSRPVTIAVTAALLLSLSPAGYSRAAELNQPVTATASEQTDSSAAAFDFVQLEASERELTASAAPSEDVVASASDQAVAADAEPEPAQESSAEDPTPEPAAEEEPVVWNAGWIGPNARGEWRYGLADDTLATNQWLQVNGNWYWFDENGVMATGFTEIEGVLYYLLESGGIEGALAGGWIERDDGWYYAHDIHDGHFGELQTGWLQLKGVWYWLDATTGRAAEDEELEINGAAYAFAASSCAMGESGWIYAGGHWYWASASGALINGWQLINGSWYFMDYNTFAMAEGVFRVGGVEYVTTASGACPSNAWVTVDGARYRTNDSSAVCTGWVTVDGSRYLFAEDGKMVTGFTTVGDQTYLLGSDGALVTNAWVRLENGVAGWASSTGAIYPADATISENGTVVFNTARNTSVTLGDATFWVQADGTLLKGWDAAHQHYTDPATGKVQSAWFRANGVWYYMNADGTMPLGWKAIDGSWYYFNADGSMFEGWLNLSGTYYYLVPGNGAMATGWTNVNGTWYWMDGSGVMQTGWLNLSGTYYYLGTTGAMQTGWLQLNGYWYYLDASGVMATGTRVINGYTRFFWWDGVCTSAGYQNPYPYYAINGQSVRPRVSYGIFSYVSPIGIGYNATRSQCVEAFIATAYRYIGTPYVWDYACAPGVGVDCAGLVLQCMYSVGMNPSRYSPYDHYNTYGHDHYANDMRNDPYIRKVAVSQRQRGDLLFWPGHVAIYIGGNQVIEAGHGHVTIGSPDYSIASATACGRLFN